MTSYPVPEWMMVRYGAHRVTRPTVAAERRGGYDGVGDDVAGDGAGNGGERSRQEPPFGLPVLASVPELAAVLDAVAGAERRMLQAVVGVSRLLASDEVAQATGVPVEHWLGIVCRQTRLDRRLLLRLARLIDRYPSVRGGVEAGRVSFAQLRGLGIVLRQAPAAIDGPLDALLARLLDELEGADPDVLVDQVRRAIVELEPDGSLEERTQVHNALWLQPNLLATGGRFGGELDAAGLAILDGATAPTRAQLHHPDSTAGIRADNLLARLVNGCDPTPGPGRTAGDQHTGAADPADPAEGAGGAGGADDRPAAAGERAAAAAGCTLPLGVQAGGLLPPVKLLARVQLETLGQLPADLLTQLTGGHLKLSSAAARWLLDTRGVELRLVVVDQGEVVGVGRASRQPPGWMADAIHAVHDTCTGPLCDRPARSADLDHARPWWPQGPDDPYGLTDIANLGPLCDSTNRDKEKAGWKAAQTGDGRRTWSHPRTGLTITTVPSTWRPPGTDPPHHQPRRAPPGNRPPGGSGQPGGSEPPGSGPPPGRSGPPDGSGPSGGTGPPGHGPARSGPAHDPDVPFEPGAPRTGGPHAPHIG